MTVPSQKRLLMHLLTRVCLHASLSRKAQRNKRECRIGRLLLVLTSAAAKCKVEKEDRAWHHVVGVGPRTFARARLT